MNRGARIAAAGAAAFLIVLIARFPARWAAGVLPRGTACLQLGGTLWSGTCTGLLAAGAPLGDLSWTAHPLQLLIGRLSVTVALTLPNGTVSSRVELRPTGTITAENLQATVPLSHALIAQLPPNTQGVLQIDLASLRWNGKRITAIRGDLSVRGLAVRGESLGDYRVSFPRDSAASGGSTDEPTGRLEDLGGPLSVQGTLRLTPAPGFVLDTQVAPRANAPRDIVQALRLLGSPDAQGRRPFTTEVVL
jgi:general secretion pathway protein N